MDFAEAFRIIRRRWRVSVPVLVLTLIATVVTYLFWPTTYQSTAQISLIPSRIIADQPVNGNNPYVAVSTLNPLAAILAGELSSDQAVQQLNRLGMTNGFTAAVPPFAAGPFISLTVTGPNSNAVQDSMPIVIRFAQQRLRQLQESAPARTPGPAQIQAVVISPASSPQRVLKRKTELVAAVVIAGLVLLLVLSFQAEGRALRRAERAQMRDDQRGIEVAHPNGERDGASDTTSSLGEMAPTGGPSPHLLWRSSTRR